MVMYRVILIVTVSCFIEAQSLLFKPWKQCVPTTTVQGICHKCSCGVDGIFYCQPGQCRDDDMETDNSNSKECEPNLTYRDGRAFCTCDATGYWRSMNCRDRFHRVRPKTTLLSQIFRTNIACTPNASYLIDCNICQCGSSGFIEPTSCTSRLCGEEHKADTCKAGDVSRVGNEFCVCSDINYYVDRLCLKLTNDAIQKLDIAELSKIFNIGRSWENIEESTNGCELNKTYTIDCNTCFCTPNGYLGCTLKACMRNTNDKENLRSKYQNEVDSFDSLPELKSEDDRCKPGQTYRFKCNRCACAADGHPTCSTMLCLQDFTWNLKAFRALGHASQGKPNVSHRLKNWKDLPVIHDGEACIPGYQYRNSCNTCYCKDDGGLMCSKMACINMEKLLSKYKKAKKVKKDKVSNNKSALRLGLSKFPNLPSGVCSPGKVYKQECQRCICGENKKAVCTKKKNACKIHSATPVIRFLEDVRTRLSPIEIEALPMLPSRQVVCKPGNLYRVECNACVCLTSEDLVCDRMACLSFDEMHRIEADEQTGKQCKSNSTQSEKDCVKCHCVDGIQDCVEIDGCITEEDTKYPIWENGKPHVWLDVYKEKCIPGAVYRLNCNNCYCQTDETLRCTQKSCLNYSQSQALEKQREYLLARGL